MSVISAGTTLTTALVQTGDTNGNLVFRTGASGTTALTLGSDQSATFAGGISLGALTTSGNLTFTGTGNRITGDFSNATSTNNVAFQTSTTNGNTNVRILPNGTGVNSNFVAVNNSDPTNASTLNLGIFGSTDTRINSTITGTGTYLPLTMYTGGSERLRIDTSGNVGIGTSSPGSFAKLIVQQTSGSNNFQIGTTTNAAGMYWISTNAYGVQQYSYGGLLALGTSDSNHLEFRTNATERMRIDSSGNVGIGTASPTYKLQVSGSDPRIAITHTTHGTWFTAAGWTGANDYSIVQAGVAEGLRVDSSNNLRFNSGYGSVATAYGCRAWVNFNGSGTPAVRGGGNVSSITDVGTGRYDVNFTTAMPDVNYSVVASDDYYGITNTGERPATTASKARIYCYDVAGNFIDPNSINVAVFR